MTLLAIQRETIMIVALASLSVAGVVFALGAFALFFRERRATHLMKRQAPRDQDQPPV
jgi:hypothetical protein